MSSRNGTNGKHPSVGFSDRKRATKAEKEDRIVETMKMVIQGRSTGDVKRHLCGKHGIVWQTALRYLCVARERLREENGLGGDFTLEDMKVQHYAVAMSIVQTSDDNKERLAALKHAGSIYGVDAPQKIAQTDPSGEHQYQPEAVEAIYREMTTPELLALKKVRDRMRALTKQPRRI